jgi:hypothetical protein
MAHVNNARRASVVAAALVVVAALSGCGDSDSDSSSADPSASTRPAAQGGNNDRLSGGETADTMAPSPDSTAAASEGAAVSTVAPAPNFGDPSDPIGIDDASRLLAIEATVTVEAENIGAAAGEVVKLAERHNGQVYASDIDLSDGPTAGGTLVIKLPPVELEAMIADLAEIGTVVARNQDTEDVTDQVMDLDTRILSAQASVDRVRAIMEKTTDLNQLVQLEADLAQRQLMLEQLLAQRDNTVDRAALSTLTVELRRPPVVDTIVEEVTAEPDEELTVGKAFSKGWDGFVTALTAVLVFIGLTAPFLGVALVLFLVLRAVMRRMPRPPATPRSRSAAPLLPPTPDADQQSSTLDSAASARIP